MEMRCYRKIVRVPYKRHIANKKVRAKVQQAIRLHEDLTMVKRRILKWYAHVFRSSGLTKTILQGTVEGGRRQDRRRDRKTTSGNGQAWSSPNPRRQWRTEKNKMEETGGEVICGAPTILAVMG